MKKKAVRKLASGGVPKGTPVKETFPASKSYNELNAEKAAFVEWEIKELNECNRVAWESFPDDASVYSDCKFIDIENRLGFADCFSTDFCVERCWVDAEALKAFLKTEKEKAHKTADSIKKTKDLAVQTNCYLLGLSRGRSFGLGLLLSLLSQEGERKK